MSDIAVGMRVRINDQFGLVVGPKDATVKSFVERLVGDAGAEKDRLATVGMTGTVTEYDDQYEPWPYVVLTDQPNRYPIPVAAHELEVLA